MYGVFIRKRWGLCGWLLLGVGILLTILFSFLLFVDNTMSPEDKVGCRIILVLSLVIVVLCLISRRFNRGAFLHLGESGLTARFAWRARLQCPYSDIAFCSCGGMTLTLRLQCGKRCTIPLLDNAAEICSELRKRIEPFRPEAGPAEAAASEVDSPRLWCFAACNDRCRRCRTANGRRYGYPHGSNDHRGGALPFCWSVRRGPLLCR